MNNTISGFNNSHPYIAQGITSTNTNYCKRCLKTNVVLLTNGLCIRCDNVLYGVGNK